MGHSTSIHSSSSDSPVFCILGYGSNSSISSSKFFAFLFIVFCIFFMNLLGMFFFGWVVMTFRFRGIFSIFFHSFVSHYLRLSIQSGTSSPDFFIRFAMVLTNYLSSSVKRVMALPWRPPRPVRPIL